MDVEPGPCREGLLRKRGLAVKRVIPSPSWSLDKGGGARAPSAAGSTRLHLSPPEESISLPRPSASSGALPSTPHSSLTGDLAAKSAS